MKFCFAFETVLKWAKVFTWTNIQLDFGYLWRIIIGHSTLATSCLLMYTIHMVYEVWLTPTFQSKWNKLQHMHNYNYIIEWVIKLLVSKIIPPKRIIPLPHMVPGSHTMCQPWVNTPHSHKPHHELICESGTCLLSKVIGQALMLHVGGGPFEVFVVVIPCNSHNERQHQYMNDWIASLVNWAH